MHWESLIPASMFLAASLLCFQRWWITPPENRGRILPGALLTLTTAVVLVVINFIL
jgi:hypothetical protein